MFISFIEGPYTTEIGGVQLRPCDTLTIAEELVADGSHNCDITDDGVGQNEHILVRCSNTDCDYSEKIYLDECDYDPTIAGRWASEYANRHAEDPS